MSTVVELSTMKRRKGNIAEASDLCFTVAELGLYRICTRLSQIVHICGALICKRCTIVQ